MFTIIFTLIVAAFIWWAVQTKAPFAQWMKTLICAVIAICCLFYVAREFGFNFHDPGVPQIGR